MSVFNHPSFDHHEQVVFCSDPSVGLESIIAVHDTQLGPAVGGCRMYPYATYEDALTDVLRLSRGMTYKCAMAGVKAGGGKAVIIGDPKKQACEKFFRSFGKFVNRLNGSYITAEDVGTNPDYMAWVKQESDHVICLPVHLGGSGNPSPVTAHGVFMGIKAAVKQLLGRDVLTDLKVAIQGVGQVGYALGKELYEAGVQLFVTDVNEHNLKRAVDEFKAIPVKSEEIYGLDVDVFSPCALGATINDETIPLLKCPIVAGSANNQLQDEIKHGIALKEKGILYAPDYVINAGGLLNAYSELTNCSREAVLAKTEGIYDTLLKIFHLAKENNVSTNIAANQIAEQRIDLKRKT
jgi:leucine dehydrogenase